MKLPLLLLWLIPFLPAQAQQFLVSPGEYTNSIVNTSTHQMFFINGSTLPIANTPPCVASVSGGAHGSALIDCSGNVWCQADNSAGELGQGDLAAHAGFVKVSTDTLGNVFTNVIQVVCAGTAYGNNWSTSAVKSDGTVWVWGNTQGGNEGNGSWGCVASTRPVQVHFPVGIFITKIQTGEDMMALDSSGNVWTWGGGGYNLILGQGNSPTYMVPTKINIGGNRATDIAGPGRFAYILMANGHVWALGDMTDYMGIFPGGSALTVAQDITSYLNFEATPKHLYVNSESSYALLADSTLWAWGGNAVGTVGNGVELNYVAYGGYPLPYGVTNPFPYAWDQGQHELQQLTPAQIAPGKHNFVALFCTDALNYCAWAEDNYGQLFSWGRGKSGVLGDQVQEVGGAINAIYPNSYDRPYITKVNPYLPTPIPVTSPYCILHPSGSPCNTYAIPANTAPTAVLTATKYGTNAIILDGSGSTDNVNINYYLHTQTAGTALQMGVQAAPIDTIYNVSPGTYTFKLRVIDNGWMRDSVYATITIGDRWPVADAGSNIIVVYPTTSTSLNGMGSEDSAATIVSYNWTKVSGPAGLTMTNMNTATPSVSNLTIGTYVFQLLVTDNLGDTSTSEVQVLSTALLPIQFDNFSGENQSNINYLSWTATADNGSYLVDRSTDGKTFISIASVPAIQDNSATHTYSYADGTAPDGISYYRIENVSETGASIFTNTIEVKMNMQGAAFLYYPNPAKDNITLQLQSGDMGPVTIRLIGVDGKVILQEQDYKTMEGYTKKIDFVNIPRGLYFISLNVGDTAHNLGKIIKE